MLSAWLAIIPQLNLAGDDMLLSAVFGGVFAGTGMGLVFRTGTTTGGTDLVAALIQLKFRHVSIVKLLQTIDAVGYISPWLICPLSFCCFHSQRDTELFCGLQKHALDS